jgi:hypothetical protein
LKNGMGKGTSAVTLYDGIALWFIKRDSDTTGGIDGKGTYYCRYASSTSVTLVNIDGTADTYDGSTGGSTTRIWQEPNRAYSKPLNPHAEPSDNVSNDYPSALLAGAGVPNTNRLLLMGREFVVAEDYDRLPIEGYTLISDQYGCSSFFSIVSAHGRLYWLDFGKGKREILMSDGTQVVPVATAKIKSILQRVTLDSNGDVWRVGFLEGEYYDKEDTIRWFLYLDNETVARYVLELDLASGDPSFYPMAYMDAFTVGKIRGEVFIGQFGWTGGVARLGQDNVPQRFRDWVEGGTLRGSLSSSSNTTTVLTIASGTLYTASSGLQGVNVMVWRESTAAGAMIANPTYYHCRISTNDSTTFTVNYVATVNAIGETTDVGVELPTTPSGAGWKWAVGVIQGMVGPKWLAGSDPSKRITLKEMSVIHKGQATATTSDYLVAHSFENFDTQPREAQKMDRKQAGQQVSDTTLFSHTSVGPKANPSTVVGFGIVDNNVSTNTYSLDIEAIVLDVDEEKQAK